MKLSFRWFGPDDPIPLSHIRQIPAVQTVVTQLYGETAGLLLNKEKLNSYIQSVKNAGMAFKVYENLAVHQSIKLGLKDRDSYIDIFMKNMSLLAENGIEVICYNYRPIFRWARTAIYKELADGSSVSAFNKKDGAKIDPFKNSALNSDWHRENSFYIYKKQLTTDLELEGYYREETTKILTKLRNDYNSIGKEGLWTNLEYFLQKIIPHAEKLGVRMALHPDDPPWDIFGVPRLFTDGASLDRLVSLYDSPANGILFCTGTLGSHNKSDVVSLVGKFTRMDRIPFAHIRNVLSDKNSMEECAHYSEYGKIDMVRLLEAMYDNGFNGYARPDHGRMIWDEQGSPCNGIYDRALGAQYILGIWETLGKIKA